MHRSFSPRRAPSARKVASASLIMAASLLALTSPTTAASGKDGYAVLKMEAGTWDADFPMPDAHGKVVHMKAVQKNTLMANGTWMLNDLYMPMSTSNAPRYHGHGVWTYNPATQRYEGIWVDQNLRSTLYWHGERPDGKGHASHFRFEEEFKGEHRVFRIYTLGWKTGKQHYCGALTFSRRPGTGRVNEDDTSQMP